MHSMNKPQPRRKAGLNPMANDMHSDHCTLSVFAIKLSSRVSAVSNITEFAEVSLQTQLPMSANVYIFFSSTFTGFYLWSFFVNPASEFLLFALYSRSLLKALCFPCIFIPCSPVSPVGIIACSFFLQSPGLSIPGRMGKFTNNSCKKGTIEKML